jgi:hypothetical protein
MHDNVTTLPTAPKPEPKLRTITLTNRAPIQIVENEWPIIAQGSTGVNEPEWPISWGMEIRVRREAPKEGLFHMPGGRVIIHAKYWYNNEIQEEGQMVRVGHLLPPLEAVGNLWQHILDVGEELRSRIQQERHQKEVVHVTDECFASLSPRINN